jgi:hypothetical protein
MSAPRVVTVVLEKVALSWAVHLRVRGEVNAKHDEDMPSCCSVLYHVCK